eukprot:1100591-Pelagomonas_calceolata.AAC.1
MPVGEHPTHCSVNTLKATHRLRAVWINVEGVNSRDTYNKLATHQSLFAVPYDPDACAPAHLPSLA